MNSKRDKMPLEFQTLPPEALQQIPAAAYLHYRKDGRILSSAIRTPDGTLLVSRDRHDYQTHVDAKDGATYMIDGGLDYCRRSGPIGKNASIYDTDPFEIIRERFLRVSYGKNFDEPKRYVALKDMTDSHLEAVIEYCEIYEHKYLDLYVAERDYREYNRIGVPFEGKPIRIPSDDEVRTLLNEAIEDHNRIPVDSKPKLKPRRVESIPKITEILRRTPLAIRIYLNLIMDDYPNWSDGEYLGDVKAKIAQTDAILADVREWILDGAPDGFTNYKSVRYGSSKEDTRGVQQEDTSYGIHF